MSTMNEQDDDTKHSYNRYMLETLQQEWDKQQQVHEAREHTHDHATTYVDEHSCTLDAAECQAHDEWVEELYSAEELERLSAEHDEKRNDL